MIYCFNLINILLNLGAILLLLLKIVLNVDLLFILTFSGGMLAVAYADLMREMW